MQTIYEDYSLASARTLIETRDDGSQVKRNIGMHVMQNTKSVMQNEDTVMLALKPYFDSGWELTASTAIQESSALYVTRFFLRKQD